MTDPTPTDLPYTMPRFVAVDEYGCWNWTGQSYRRYGRYWIPGSNRNSAAYRVAYEALMGPIPAGLEMDHLCSNPPCVNPLHLEPVTRAENMRRRAARRTHCHRGHPWTPANTMPTTGGRKCRICKNIKDNIRRQRARRARGLWAGRIW